MADVVREIDQADLPFGSLECPRMPYMQPIRPHIRAIAVYGLPRKMQDATAFMQSPRFLQNFRLEGEKLFRVV